MAWRFHGRATVDANNPQAFAICDDCNFLYNLVDLKYQYEWRGSTLKSTGYKKCWRCMDIPNDQGRPRILPPDPVPVVQPRPGTMTVQEAGTLAAGANAYPVVD